VTVKCLSPKESLNSGKSKDNAMTKQTLNLLKGKYVYLSDYNQVLDPTLEAIFRENTRSREVPVQDIEVSREILAKRIQNIPQLIFEVSANCNLRCTYCVYNGNYFNQRRLVPKNMDFETARKGIDTVYSHIKDRNPKEFALSFYGGEPLLNVGTIRQIINYSRERFRGWELHYNMTSNLTLLDEASLEMLIENNISLLVSLDGDKVNHDAKRLDINNKGTFDTIINNLERIRNRSVDYFRRKVGFSSVYSMDLPLENMVRFFTDHKELRDMRVRFNTVNTYNTDYYKDHPYDREGFRSEFKTELNRILDKVREEKKLSGLESHLFTAFMETGTSLKIHNYSVLGGACMFDDRLYLDSSGGFHICEKMNNTFSIGDVDNGFNFVRMEAIVKDFATVVKKHCLDCSIRYLCKRCYVTFGGDGIFEINPEFCKNQKESIVRKLEQYILWMEDHETRKRQELKKKQKSAPGMAAESQQVYRFRQFVGTMQGPVNTAIIDQLKGNIFQVENWMVDKFEKGHYDKIQEFMNFVHEEGLISEAGENRWYPPTELDWPPEEFEGTVFKTKLELHIEEGIELDPVLEKLQDTEIYQVYYYGKTVPNSSSHSIEIIAQEKNENRCIQETTIDSNFPPVSPISYQVNRKYNSCWGGKIAVKNDGSVRPCIYSHMILGNIHTDDMASILKKLKTLWLITHDKIEKCKDCELKYVCRDCREFAMRETGNLHSAPVNCFYNPHTGTWKE
jgi:uncharacterized protein